MALVVMLSTVSFTVDMHFCGDNLVSFSLLKDAESCGMGIQQHSSSWEEMIASKSCCSDKEFVKEGQKDLKKSYEQFTSEKVTALFIQSFAYLQENITSGNKPFRLKDYSPPHLNQDLKALYETYLI